MLHITPEMQFAIKAVHQAAVATRQVQGELALKAISKTDLSPVTVGDFAAQAIVASLLETTFPNDPLVGEEDADSFRVADGQETLDIVTSFVKRQRASATPDEVCRWIDRGAGDARTNRYWTLDPIDGTKGFLRREQYAVALALIENFEVRLGVLGCPQLPVPGDSSGATGSIFIAARGEGCWYAPLTANAMPEPEQFQRTSVSTRNAIADARLFRSVETSHTSLDDIDRLVELLGISAKSIGMDSQAKYAAVASASGESIIRFLSPKRPDYREKIWDQAAGLIVVEEAGGRVTDLTGKSLDFSHGRTLEANQGVLVSNGLLHEALLAGLRTLAY